MRVGRLASFHHVSRMCGGEAPARATSSDGDAEVGVDGGDDSGLDDVWRHCTHPIVGDALGRPPYVVVAELADVCLVLCVRHGVDSVEHPEFALEGSRQLLDAPSIFSGGVGSDESANTLEAGDFAALGVE